MSFLSVFRSRRAWPKSRAAPRRVVPKRAPAVEWLEDRCLLDATTSGGMSAGYGQLPLRFEANLGQTNSDVVTVTVNSVNDAPVANPDTTTTNEGMAIVKNVLANDSDADGDTLSVIGVSDPPNGTAAINLDGTITFTPDSHFCGTETFTYTISDSQGGSDTSTVVVTVQCSTGGSADFNGDGFSDLAVGVPAANDTASDSGAVHVIYGSPVGLAADTTAVFTQDSLGVDVSEPGDQFGMALAVGDFNGDGLESGDRFASSLAVGDFNGDEIDDLAIGAPFENVGSVVDAGAVSVLYGAASARGLSADQDQFWTQNSFEILDEAEPTDRFGHSLAAADFDGDGRDDLAIGVPLQNVGTIIDAGAVHVIYGSALGLAAVNNQFWTQDSPDIVDQAQIGDSFGYSLAAADFNGDGRSDLAIGVPGENVVGVAAAGLVHGLYGSATLLSAAASRFWTRNSFPGHAAAPLDRFGATLAANDYNADGKADLAIATPNQDFPTVPDAGAVRLLYGRSDDLSIAPLPQLWTQLDLGIFGEPNDRFGTSLS